jgi:hypothetical protein
MTQATDDAIKWHLRVFDDLGNRVADAIADLKHDDAVDLPIGIRSDLQQVEPCMMRVRGWLRDEQGRQR